MEKNNIDDREVAELKKLLGDIPADEDSALPGMRNQASASRTANSDPGATQRVSISRATQAAQTPEDLNNLFLIYDTAISNAEDGFQQRMLIFDFLIG